MPNLTRIVYTYSKECVKKQPYLVQLYEYLVNCFSRVSPCLDPELYDITAGD